MHRVQGTTYSLDAPPTGLEAITANWETCHQALVILCRGDHAEAAALADEVLGPLDRFTTTIDLEPEQVAKLRDLLLAEGTGRLR
jgi:hypothetical protein